MDGQSLNQRRDALSEVQPEHTFATERACIRIKNLRLRTYIGINTDETLNKQDVVINIMIWYDALDAIKDDCIENALNYRSITKTIIHHVEERRFGLLERLAQEVLSLVLDSPAVHGAEVEVDKPHALRFADSVSVVLRGVRADD